LNGQKHTPHTHKHWEKRIRPSVSGGKENKATGEGSSISGGGGGEASGAVSSVTGGRLGKAPYFASTVLGGLEEVTEAEFASHAMSAAARWSAR
jgi:hypothetical protein